MIFSLAVFLKHFLILNLKHSRKQDLMDKPCVLVVYYSPIVIRLSCNKGSFASIYTLHYCVSTTYDLKVPSESFKL